jgi:hypothetical protein
MKTNVRRAVLSFIFYVSFYGLPGLTWAQSAANSGQMVGQVLDPSSASVAGAEVTARNKNTNFSRSTTTDDAGRYAVSLLPLGPYEVAIKAPGFDPATQEALVMLGSTITVNFNLSVGVNREQIQVTADVLTEPTVAPSRSVLTELQLRHLPSNGGRVQNIIWDVPTGQIEPE